MIRVFALALVLIACHHDAAPLHPDPSERPPLPPSSGTPIGFLLDDGDLHLRDDQRARLQEIDATLAGELGTLEARERAAHPVAASEPANEPSMGRRGGRGGGGRRGRSRQAQTGGPPVNGAPKPDVGAVAQERSADVREALHRAFAILDPDQQRVAEKLLTAHDIDVDTTPHEPTSPESTEP
jgi:hypothetical protein